MDIGLFIAAAISIASFCAWLWLIFARGWFWTTDQRLHIYNKEFKDAIEWPPVVAIIPARNEAEYIAKTLPTVLSQEYPGYLSVVLVDDMSEDDTLEIAGRVARTYAHERVLTLVAGKPTPSGWAGKVWALHQGMSAAVDVESTYVWLTDADITHGPRVLASLVRKIKTENLSLASVMATLSISTFWDRLLIPAFVFFFAKLYPFRWVSDRSKTMAGAAGGCILVVRRIVESQGGMESIKGEIIDDCALARLVKDTFNHDGLWLGLSHNIQSIRPYGSLRTVWGLVVRTAYIQVGCSIIALQLTVIGMLWLYAIPPISVLVGGSLLIWTGYATYGFVLLGSGLVTWLMFSIIYIPFLNWYRVCVILAPGLSIAAFLYTLMTMDSARRTWTGKAGGWKKRTYETKVIKKHR